MCLLLKLKGIMTISKGRRSISLFFPFSVSCRYLLEKRIDKVFLDHPPRVFLFSPVLKMLCTTKRIWI